MRRDATAYVGYFLQGTLFVTETYETAADACECARPAPNAIIWTYLESGDRMLHAVCDATDGVRAWVGLNC